MLAALFFVLAFLGVTFALVVLRADPRRWDNRVFAAMALLDGATSAYRGLVLGSGRSLEDLTAEATCGRSAIVMVWIAIEFAASFPFSRPAPARIRVPTLFVVGATLALSLVPPTRDFVLDYCEFFLFIPAFAAILALAWRNLRKAGGDRSGIVVVMGAIVFRWANAVMTWAIARFAWPNAFPAFGFFDATAAVLVSYVALTAAILRGQLFSVRGLVAEVVGYAGVAVGIGVLAVLAVDGALRAGGGPTELRVSLVMASLVPLAAAAVAVPVRGRIRGTLLRALDPDRRKHEAAVTRAADTRDPAPEAMLARVVEAIAEITGQPGAAGVRYLRARGPLAAPALPPVLADHFATSSAPWVHRTLTPDLPAAVRSALDADVLVPVRSGAPGIDLFGALAITGGRLDRETLVAAGALADRLALKLENFELFAELETSRRLATLGAFAAAIAHDIRTPLTSVKMNVQILRAKAKAVQLPEDDMEHFVIALEELDRLGASIGELLDYAKPIQVQRTSVDLRDIVEDASRAVQSHLSGRGVTLDQRHDARLPTVVGDAQRLRQVIVNLLENAANASQPGRAVTIATRSDDGGVAIDVIDEGTGIDGADIEHIFEPFFTKRADGTGLGLAICRKVVRAHAGEIRVRSSPGAGSTFTVLLPRDASPLQA